MTSAVRREQDRTHSAVPSVEPAVTVALSAGCRGGTLVRK
jgi:hypothetical protein